MSGISGTVVIVAELCNPFGVKNGFGFGRFCSQGGTSRSVEIGAMSCSPFGAKNPGLWYSIKGSVPGCGAPLSGPVVRVLSKKKTS